MSTEEKSLNFIEQIIEDDLKNGLSNDKLRFRFPPEPNGYLHVGHASAICLNFGLGIDYKAPVNLRFDDTNPSKEEQEFVDAIKKDVEWLGFSWDKECYASDYFQIRGRIILTRKFFPFALPGVYLSLLVTMVRRLWRRQWKRVGMILKIIWKN